MPFPPSSRIAQLSRQAAHCPGRGEEAAVNSGEQRRAGQGRGEEVRSHSRRSCADCLGASERAALTCNSIYIWSGSVKVTKKCSLLFLGSSRCCHTRRPRPCYMSLRLLLPAPGPLASPPSLARRGRPVARVTRVAAGEVPELRASSPLPLTLVHEGPGPGGAVRNAGGGPWSERRGR